MRHHIKDVNLQTFDDFKNQCRNKVELSSKKMARSVANKMKREGRAGSSLQPYRCKQCRKWHVGHSWRRDEAGMNQRDEARVEVGVLAGSGNSASGDIPASFSLRS